jgi:hypothetical protein
MSDGLGASACLPARVSTVVRVAPVLRVINARCAKPAGVFGVDRNDAPSLVKPAKARIGPA